MKKLTNFFVPLILIMILSAVAFVPVSADNSRVFDKADLFSSQQEKKLQIKIDKLQENNPYDFVVLTTDDTNGENSVDYLNNFYYSNSFNDNGCLLLIDMDNRRVEVRYFGAIQENISTFDSDTLCDNVYYRVKEKSYYKAADRYLDDVIPSINGTIKDSKFKQLTPVELLISFGVAIIAFLAIFIGVKNSYGSEGKAHPYPFKEKANLDLQKNQDLFVREYTTHTTISKSSGSSGSSSHSSGGGSSGSGRSF